MRDIELLHPTLQSKYYKLRDLARNRLGLNIKNTNTLRINDEQYALWMKGRASLDQVNAALKIANIGPITDKENHIVTKAKNVDDSFHGYGVAFDIAILSPDGKKIIWDPSSDWNNDGKDDWVQVGQLADECGLEWGGNWTGMPDPPHYQDRMGLTIAKLKVAKVISGTCITDEEIKRALGFIK